jgi:phosphoesterase RecJ-like protein
VSALVEVAPAAGEQSDEIDKVLEDGHHEARAAALTLIRSAIRDGGWVLCMGHIQPDGDALGSALALAMAIRRVGGRALVSFDPGGLAFGMPPSLSFLPGADLLVDPDRLPAGAAGPAAVITFDTGSPERLGSLARFVSVPSAASADRVVDVDAPPVLVVDHHACGSPFGSQRFIDVAAAATAELVASLIDGLGVALTADLAACLYAGLASDTGSFRYAATSSSSHRLAARLLAAGAPHAQISSQLWDTRPASYLCVLTSALGRLQRSDEIIWTYVTAEDLSQAGASIEEAEGIVDVIRVAREHEVAAVLKEDTTGAGGRWKVSVRSRGKADVGAACTALGGGGHRLAAGFGADGDPAEIISRLQATLAAGE